MKNYNKLVYGSSLHSLKLTCCIHNSSLATIYSVKRNNTCTPKTSLSKSTVTRTRHRCVVTKQTIKFNIKLDLIKSCVLSRLFLLVAVVSHNSSHTIVAILGAVSYFVKWKNKNVIFNFNIRWQNCWQIDESTEHRHHSSLWFKRTRFIVCMKMQLRHTNRWHTAGGWCNGWIRGSGNERRALRCNSLPTSYINWWCVESGFKHCPGDWLK